MRRIGLSSNPPDLLSTAIYDRWARKQKLLVKNGETMAANFRTTFEFARFPFAHTYAIVARDQQTGDLGGRTIPLVSPPAPCHLGSTLRRCHCHPAMVR